MFSVGILWQGKSCDCLAIDFKNGYFKDKGSPQVVVLLPVDGAVDFSLNLRFLKALLDKTNLNTCNMLKVSKGYLTIGSVGTALPSHHDHFYAQKIGRKYPYY